MKHQHKVELLPAWMWTCDECGRDNFERITVVDVSPEDATEFCRSQGIDESEFEPGELASAPMEVTCTHCGAEFETDDPEQSEESP